MTTPVGREDSVLVRVRPEWIDAIDDAVRLLNGERRFGLAIRLNRVRAALAATPSDADTPLEAWGNELAICPMCHAFAFPRYHSPDSMSCSAPSEVRASHHNHLNCRCGYVWTLPPRSPEAIR